MEERVGFLHWQLDSFGVNASLLGGLLLLGGGQHDRISGGALQQASHKLWPTAKSAT